MIRSRKVLIMLFAGALLMLYSPATAVPPDFNADRRVNIKCPCSIDHDHQGQFAPDGFRTTLKRLYNELDDNLSRSAQAAVQGQHGEGYAFSDDPNQGRFFVCHAKAAFPYGRLESLIPREKIEFQEVFYIIRIDWSQQQLEIVRQRDKRRFSIDVPDFEEAFLWYNALLDKQRAYIPIYGFLSLPGEADDFPTIWDGWEAHKNDTATPPESLVDYDFYKILDYRDGYYLLGKDYNELDYRSNIEDFGIIGWVQRRYITLWRSRLYYHPMQRVTFYDDQQGLQAAPETEEINKFYVDHVYLKERMFSDIVEKLDQNSLHKFYTHFGFPQLIHPASAGEDNYSQVFIPGAFTPRLMRMLGSSVKKNLNVFFLLDVSESMRPFADYVKSFNKSVADMKERGIGLRMNRIFAYWDSAGSDRDPAAEPGFTRVKRPDQLRFIQKSKDRNYSEPLMRAFRRTLHEIESLQLQRHILPLHPKLLFIITDAGPNDLSPAALDETHRKARELNLQVYFVYPTSSGVRTANAGLEDTPVGAYALLEDLVNQYQTRPDSGRDIHFRTFKFKVERLGSSQARRKDFALQHRRLLGGIETYLNHVFNEAGAGAMPKDVILYFSDEALLNKMRRWSHRKIQVLNHVIKFIRQVDDPGLWEERIAIPAKPVEAFLRAIRTQDDVSLSDLKKLVIINSLVSVDDIEKCRKLYDHIKPLIEKKTFQTADVVFYRALTNREPGKDVQWNRALGQDQGPLGEYLAQRGFHLNSFNQAVQRKFMYLNVGDLYSDGL